MNNVIMCPLYKDNYCLNSCTDGIFLSHGKLMDFYKAIVIFQKQGKAQRGLQLPSLFVCEAAANIYEYGYLFYIHMSTQNIPD
jgi:hypothetical protein